MPYVPIHLRVRPAPGAGPSYAPPDEDLSAEFPPPLPHGWGAMSDSDTADRPAKRRREESPASGPSSRNGSVSAGHGHAHRSHAPPGLPPAITESTPIAPSIFGIAPRNEFTKIIGEFVMTHCRGVDNVEVEIKLGTIHAAGEGPQRRARMPTMTEMIVPPDYPIGKFSSTMTQAQHASLNRLLNSTVESSAGTEMPLRFFRAQHVDSFYGARGGKVRVSRDKQGAVVPGGVVQKRRLADLNVVSPREAFDWRVSASVEVPAELPAPETPAQSARQKDRACYRHQLCQVDLTVVTSKDENLAPGQRGAITYELEIEVLDVPALVAEGEKEERGEPNRFDDILQSVLDTARMLIRNV